MLPRLWISKLVVELLDCTITFTLKDDPDCEGFSLKLKFREVGNVQVERYHATDLDSTCLGDFSPIRVENLKEGRMRFHADTGDAKLIFEALGEPSLSFLDNSQITYADLFTNHNELLA